MRENSRLHKRRNDPGFTRDGQARFGLGITVNASTSAHSRVQRTKRQGRAATARPAARAPQLLPANEGPKIDRGSLADGAELDAILVVVPDSPAKTLFEPLPESERWQELNARSKPRSGTVRTTVLANRRQTYAVLGYIGAMARRASAR